MTKQRKQLLTGAICAVIAVIAVFGYTASVKSEAETQRAAALASYGGEQVDVVVASADLDAGQELSAANTQTVPWLVDLLPEGNVATSLDQVSGMVAGVGIKKNEPILLERVGSSASRIIVPDGLEAVSISSDDVLAVGGAIQAGALVDVYVETSAGTIVLLGQRVVVLETNVSVNADKSSIAWVTLAVTPESVSELISAASDGRIHLALPSASGTEGGSK